MKEFKFANIQGRWIVYTTDFMGTTYVCQAMSEEWANRIVNALNQMEIES